MKRAILTSRALVLMAAIGPAALCCGFQDERRVTMPAGAPPGSDPVINPNVEPARAPTPDEIPAIELNDELRAAVAGLDSESYTVREHATQRLRRGDVTKHHMYAILAQDGLSVEQRTRALAVLEELIDQPRGAMGIQMRQPLIEDGVGYVEVTQLIPGMPAERVLQIGDRITHVDGHEMGGGIALGVIVQLKSPGEAVSLRLLRRMQDEAGRIMFDDSGQAIYEPIEFALELGSYETLENNSRGGRLTTEIAERRRMEIESARLMYGSQPNAVQVENAVRAEDMHPAIRTLLDHRRQIRRGWLSPSEVEVEWKQGFERLKAQIDQIDSRGRLSEQDRAYFQRVLDRYLAIMQDTGVIEP